jgi:4-amino-4-deoxy-L-arabinose transferase-like glycosyltransferase
MVNGQLSMKLRRDLILIILLAFILRAGISIAIIALFPGDKFDYYVDTYGYMLLAQNLLAGNGFSGSTTPPYCPDNYRTPGFPLTLALVYWLFDYNIAPFFILNSLISALTCGVAYLLFRRILEDKVAFLGALLLLIDVDSIMYANFVLSETLDTFFLILAIHFLVEYYQRGGIQRLIVFGLMMGMAVYVRPAGLYLAPIVILALALYRGFKADFNLKKVFLALLVFYLTLLPWYLRNWNQIGRWEFSSIGVTKLMRYNTRAFAEKEARAKGIKMREQIRNDLEANIQEWREQNPDFVFSHDGMPYSDKRQYEYLNLVAPQVKKLLRRHFARVVMTHLVSSLGGLISTEWWGFNQNILHHKLDITCDVRSAFYWALTGNMEQMKFFLSGKHFWIVLLSFAWTFVNYIFAVIGFVYLIKKRRYEIALLFFLLISFHIFIGGIDSLARFRVPVLPYIFGLSAVGIFKVQK